MKNNEAILAALDALTIAVNANTRKHNETLEQRYGPKPVGLVPPPFVKTMLTNGLLCDQSLYSRAEGHGNMAHRCNRPIEHTGAHTTSIYQTPVNWYGK